MLRDITDKRHKLQKMEIGVGEIEFNEIVLHTCCRCDDIWNINHVSLQKPHFINNSSKFNLVTYNIIVCKY